MGALFPQVIAEDRASSAQIIDGSLKFDKSITQYLTRIPQNHGNMRTWTWSGWVKPAAGGLAIDISLFGAYNTSNYRDVLRFNGTGSNSINFTRTYNSTPYGGTTNSKQRDYGGNAWYHVVLVWNDAATIYVNGVEQTLTANAGGNSHSLNGMINNNIIHYIGAHSSAGSAIEPWDGQMSQVYFIDGQALGPEYFGFTDPLTNTWRPKKYTGKFTQSSFNDGTWNATSSLSTTDTISSSTPAGNGFDGDLTTKVETTNAAAGISLTFAPNNGGINFTTSLEVYCDQGSNVPTATWNGNTVNPGGGAWVTVYSGAGELSSTYPLVIDTETAVEKATLKAVRLDGEILIDGLNNTGVNSFYLPFDGNSPIGEDKSGNGNDWDPKGFGSLELDNPNVSGALPILNTTQGGVHAGVGVRTDAFSSNLVLALPLVGNANDVSNQINSGTTAKVITANDAIGVTSTSNFYNGSYYFDGSGDNIESADSSDFAFGTGDITIEMWVYFNSLVGTLWDSGAVNTNGNCCIFVDASYTYWYMKPGTDIYVLHTTSGLNINRWNHLAFVRQGSTCKIYINGKAQVTETNASNVTAEKGKIGALTGYNQYHTNGYIQDVRVYKGAAKYTSDFVVPSTSPDIFPDTPSGVSGGSKLTNITEGAVTFDGTNDYLEIADNADFEMGTDDFTIECFMYNREDTTQSVVTKYGDNVSNRSFWLGTLTSQRPSFYWYNGSDSYNIDGAAGTLPLNKWSHVVAQRTSGDIYLFVDGKVVASSTGENAAKSFNDLSEPVVIGSDSYSGVGNDSPFEGIISNVRIVKGTGVYNTSGFTPPTAPLTNVTNTKLLCCQSDVEQQNNFIRMFKSTSLYTTKADVLANATEIADGDSLASEYWYIIPEGTEPIDGDNNKAFSTVPSWNINTKFYYYNTGNSTWTGISGGYQNADYVFVSGGTVGFSYQDNDTSNSYAINPARDFYVCGNTSGTNQPAVLTGNAPTRIHYYKFNGAVKPTGSNIIGNQSTTAIKLNPFNTDINTVRGQESGYCTWNPLFNNTGTGGGNGPLSDGNLYVAHSVHGVSLGNFEMTSGKWYFEAYIENGNMFIGVMGSDFIITTESYNWNKAYGIYPHAPNFVEGGSFVTSPRPNTGAVVGYGGLYGVAVDVDNRKLWIHKDGKWTDKSPLSGVGDVKLSDDSPGFFPWFHSAALDGNNCTANFGQKPFKFPPPDGFQPLNAANVRSETIVARSDQYVGVTTYSGNGDNDALANTTIDTSTAYRYHRILFEGDTNGGSVSEIEFYDANGNKIDASDTNNAGNSINSNATQGLDHWTAFNGTRGGSDYSQGVRKDAGVGAVGFYISKDWGAGQSKIIYGVKVWGVNSYGLAGNTSGKYMKLQGSNDNSNWTDLQTWNSARHGSWTTNSANQVGHISDQTIYNPIKLGMQPDLVWIKKTSGSNAQHRLVDSVRGPNEELSSDTTQDSGSNNGLNSFDPDGFTVWTSNSGYNESGQDYVGWTWKAGGNKNTFNVDDVGYASAAAAGLTAGDVTPTGASVGTKQGFSIIRWTAPTWNGSPQQVPHGLTQSPSFMMTKVLDDQASWYCYHKNMDDTNPEDWYLVMNGYDHRGTTTNAWGINPPDNTTFGDRQLGWGDGKDVISYIWHDVPGLQKFGSYKANTDADGPYIKTGFKVGLLMIKVRGGTGSNSNTGWYIYDTERNKFNPSTKYLRADSSGNQGNANDVDLLSDGFKLRTDVDAVNNSTYNDYIYCAWAESPTFNLYGGQSNAR